jgi:serine/threonine protein kinase
MPIGLDIFYEAACLRQAAAAAGAAACALLECGVTRQSYWLVLECGDCDFQEFASAQRATLPAQPTAAAAVLELLILLFIDACKVVQCVHGVGIVHFDIKAANFLLRAPPVPITNAATDAATTAAVMLPHLRRALSSETPSGLLFLADFGEALLIQTLYARTENRPVALVRARGTLFLQVRPFGALLSPLPFHSFTLFLFCPVLSCL